MCRRMAGRNPTEGNRQGAAMTHQGNGIGEARGGMVQAEAGQAQGHRVQGVTCERLLRGDGV